MIHRRLRSVGQSCWLAGLLFLSCGPGPPSPPALEVEYSGCGAVYLPGPVCALHSTRQLKLWVKAEIGTEMEILAGGQPVASSGEESQGGRRFQLSIPPRVSQLTVLLRQPAGDASWSLRLAEPEVPVWLAQLESEEMAQRLAHLRTTAPRREQGLILRMLAYLAFEDGRNGEAAALLRQGIAADRAERCLTGEVEKTGFLSRILLDQGRFREVRQALTALPSLREAPGKSKYLVAFYRGLLADRVGDYRSALEELRKAADLADRLGMKTERWQAEQVLARILQDLGRSEDASELFARLRSDPHPEKPCDLGSLLTNAAWSRLLAREGGTEAGDPTPMLEEAQAIFDENGCRPDQRLNAHLNLTFAHQQAGRWPEARQSLHQTRPLESHADLRQRLWRHDLEARAAIAGGRPERALVLYGELEELAERALSPEGRFRAFFGRARARLALGQRQEALAALAGADRSIDEQSWQIPIHEGRDTFVAQREEATRLYLELLLAEGRREEAFTLARRARSRLLRQLAVRDRLAQLTPEEQRKWDKALSGYRALRAEIDQRAAQEWQLPRVQRKRARKSRASQLARAQEDLDRAVAGLGAPGGRGGSWLPAPGPGEVILAYHPLPRGWVGFAADARGIEVSTFELPVPLPADPVALSRILLAPFRPVIERARRVRVLPYGSLRPVDFHALPFGGEPLLTRRAVVYSLDLPVLPSPAPRGRQRALLVSDPQGNLLAARDEAAAIAGVSRTWGPAWTLERLDGMEAGAERVRQALPRATLFHYAGHGTFAGFAGWSSELKLADGSRLTVGDILALRPAPAWVVLSACEGGRSSEEAPGEGIGLAHAFLLAGAHAVIAANQRVPDRTARDLMRELYRGWQPGEDLPRQFQQAQLASRRQDPAGRWASFRLLVP